MFDILRIFFFKFVLKFVIAFIPFGAYKVQLPVISERSPLCVDDHVLLAGEVRRVQDTNVLDVLEVAGVGPSPEDETNPASVVLPSATNVEKCVS